MRAWVATLMLVGLCFGMQGAYAATGGTTVAVDGANATITVHIDLCCAADASEQTIYGPLIQAEVKAAEDKWNAALAKLPGKGCYNLSAAFEARLLKTGDPWDPGYHQIHIDFTHPGRSFSMDPRGTSANDDSDTTYAQVVDGTFYESDMSVGTWTHEIGHLMGLGDDYYNEHGLGYQAGACVPGRETSLMCHSDDGTIDQDLADRLADVINKANRLPQCWKGTLQAHAQGNIYNDTADSRFSFTVSPDGAIKGKASVQMSHAPQTMPGGCIFTRSQDPEEFDVSIDGRRNGDDFELNFGTALATYTVTSRCQGHSGTGSVPGMDAFMGGSDIMLRDSPLHGGPAKVPAEDGSTTLHGSLGGDNRATAMIQIECASCTPGPRLMK